MARGRQIARKATSRGRKLPGPGPMNAARGRLAGAMRDQLYNLIRRQGQRSNQTGKTLPRRDRISRNRVDRELKTSMRKRSGGRKDVKAGR